MSEENTAAPATKKDKPVKVARVRVLKDRTRIRNCYRTKGAIADGVPLADAEFKAKEGLLEILEVGEA